MRKPDEDYRSYRKRLKAETKQIKNHLKGVLVHKSKHFYAPPLTKGVTYIRETK